MPNNGSYNPLPCRPYANHRFCLKKVGDNTLSQVFNNAHSHVGFRNFVKIAFFVECFTEYESEISCLRFLLFLFIVIDTWQITLPHNNGI